MKKVLFITNLPSPYRVDFFNLLGEHCDLTVCYERFSSQERNKKWVLESKGTYKEVFLKLKPVGVDQSKGDAIKKYIKNANYDILIFTNYASPAIRKAIIYCILHKKKYYIEYDGGFFKKDRIIKRIIKKFLLCSASGHFTTSSEHMRYLTSLGIKNKNIYKYPFSSISHSDLINIQQNYLPKKNIFRQKYNMHEKFIILSVGRFSYNAGYGKGFDVLLEISKKINPNYGVYIVGDEPTQEFLEKKKKYNINNVHFIGFLEKKYLLELYSASDMFILLTRGDVWGLVINEAMTFGLPIITTKYCVSGCELIENYRNGFIVDINNIPDIINKIGLINNNQFLKEVYKNNIDKIENYTIEKMVDYHMNIINKLEN